MVRWGSWVALGAALWLASSGASFGQAKGAEAVARETVAAMTHIATALEAYATDYGVYPSAHDFHGLQRALVPNYARSLPERDGWGRAFFVDSSGHHYELRSYGADGKRDRVTPRGETEDPKADLILSDGQWLQRFRVVERPAPRPKPTEEEPGPAPEGDPAQATAGEMRKLATALEAYEVDYGAYPRAQSVAQLREVLVPLYAKSLSGRDGWGHDFSVGCPGDRYELRSYGADGKRDKGAPRGETDDPGADLILVDGAWVQCPRGACRCG